jgi:hypothetical protein
MRKTITVVLLSALLAACSESPVAPKSPKSCPLSTPEPTSFHAGISGCVVSSANAPGQEPGVTH